MPCVNSVGRCSSLVAWLVLLLLRLLLLTGIVGRPGLHTAAATDPGHQTVLR